jgi:predicted O-methyltransferase YrrM
MIINNHCFDIFIKLCYICLIIVVTIINNKSTKNSFTNLHPETYGREIFDQIKSKYNEGAVMSENEYYFVNGLIRLYRPKKLLEIGVCSGGMSAAILNSIKDINGAMLYSCDLEKNNYKINSNKYKVGHFVFTKFPNLMNKWRLYTGNTTSNFIEDIGGNIDFVFIDTAHVMPGEVLNIIEILPFLKKNAIIAFDDISHQTKENLAKIPYFYSCNNLLFSILRGKKILFQEILSKQGAVILDNNQKKYYFEYFYLLLHNWSYMPNKFELITIRNFVEKYYSQDLLHIFDVAVKVNYNLLKIKGLLDKDYILYTYNIKRKNPFNKTI